FAEQVRRRGRPRGRRARVAPRLSAQAGPEGAHRDGRPDATPDPKDPLTQAVRARLLDLFPGRSATVYSSWLIERGDAFRAGVEVATLGPFHGYENAMDETLDEAASVL